MYSQTTSLDFTSQKFFVGIDVHRKSWKVCIRANNMELKTFSMNPSAEELARYMHKHYPGGSYYSVYEAGFCGYWIHRELETYGFHNIVINPADVPTTGKEKSTKTDTIDSRKLARERENGSLQGIYIPDEFHQQLRSLCRLRFSVVQAQTRVKNRIKGCLAFYGHPLPRQDELAHWSGAFIKWLRSLEFSSPAGQDYLRFCIEELESHRQRLALILRTLRRYCKEYGLQAHLDALCSVSGIGFVTAITLYTELIDINRFRTLDHLASYVGLVPSVEASGEKATTRGLTFRRNRYLRYLLIEAAWVAVRKDPALMSAFNQLLRRMSKQKAIIRIARKLLNRIRHVWKHHQPYVTGVVG